MPRDPKAYRSVRRNWWLRPGVLLPALLLVLLAVPVLLWIHTYGSIAADLMFVITYFSLTLWFIYFMKGNLLEPSIKRDAQAVERKRKEIDEHRRKQRSKVYHDEIRSVSRGDVTPVLAVWAMDPAKQARHPFIEGFRVCRIDPREKELHLRIHLDDEWTFAQDSDQEDRLLDVTTAFVRFMFRDPDVRAFRPFWDTGIIVAYRMMDDGSLTGAPVPVLSLQSDRTSLEGVAIQGGTLSQAGDLIYRHGEEIEPHRSFDLR